LVAEKGEYTATREMRKHVAWYTKGLYESNRFRDTINLIESSQGMKDALHFYLEELLKHDLAEIAQ
ncbi:MAG: tRNA dihydrouridine synthase DusB, partial [Tumebacillaceae bacterium]